jgi:hypothetical protein
VFSKSRQALRATPTEGRCAKIQDRAKRRTAQRADTEPHEKSPLIQLTWSHSLVERERVQKAKVSGSAGTLPPASSTDVI